MMRPPLHSVAYGRPSEMLAPPAWPGSLILSASLATEPGRLPRSMALPWLHSTAQSAPRIHSAYAGPAVSPSIDITAKMGSPSALQNDINPSSEHVMALRHAPQHAD